MFEIESKNQDAITIITKKSTINFNTADFSIDAGLAVGKITGPGEFEIGDGECGIKGDCRANVDETIDEYVCSNCGHTFDEPNYLFMIPTRIEDDTGDIQVTFFDNLAEELIGMKKEEIIKSKEEILQLRNDLDKEIKERRGEIQLQEKRLIQKEENLEKRTSIFEGKEKDLERKFTENEKKRQELDEMYDREVQELQRISGLTRRTSKT